MCPEIVEAYNNVKIMREDPSSPPTYILLPPKFTEVEQQILHDSRSLIGDYDKIMKDVEKLSASSDKEKYISDFIREKLDKSPKINPEHKDAMILKIMDDIFLGYGKIGPLMRDDNLEEIMVNSPRSNAFIVHRRHGMCMTNIRFDADEDMDRLINWLSKYAGREITKSHPLLDAHMPDGSRANVAVPPAAPYGPSITIRKFKRVPFTIIDLIDKGSLTAEIAAFLWVCIEGLGVAPSDMIIAGGAGSGKTTLLNAMAMFIPQSERVVTVEDTMELNFHFVDNWVPMEANPAVLDDSKLTMHSLLQNSLRMRPDRVIVGEVRGKEAETLLIAMDIGLHGSMGTIHANNARETTIRLMDEPMNVPIRMLPLINLIVVMGRYYDRQKGMTRRLMQLAEIAGIEQDVVQMGDIYLWDVKTDKIMRTEYPIMLKEKIAQKCGITKKRLNAELFIREKVIQYLVDNNIRDYADVMTLIQRYNADPKSVVTDIKDSLYGKEGPKDNNNNH